MRAKRSAQVSSVMPVLSYPDAAAASEWLCAAFGFRQRFRVGDHRAQLVYGNGAVIVTEGKVQPSEVQVRVDDLAAHHDHARAHGAQVVRAPNDGPHGGRQYTAVDPGGHRWTFSQTSAQGDPHSEGGARSDDDGTDWISVFSAADDPDVTP